MWCNQFIGERKINCDEHFLKVKSLFINVQTQLSVKQSLASSVAFSVQQLSRAKDQKRLQVYFCRHWVGVFSGILSECGPTCRRLRCGAVYFGFASSLDWSAAHRSSTFWLRRDPPGHPFRGAGLLIEHHLNRDVLPDIGLISSWYNLHWSRKL